jgi:hypothetical protein
MVTFAGNFVNPFVDMLVMTVGEVSDSIDERDPDAGEVADDDRVKFCIAVPVRCECPHACCSRPVIGHRFHTSAPFFDETEDAEDWIEAQSERLEGQYDNYLEENRHDIVQMERYEMWRAEY